VNDAISDIQRLIAIEDIKQLKARRDRAVDSKDWDTYTALHAPDHYSHNYGEERRDGAAVNTEFVKKALGPDVISVHHSHTPDITFDSPTKARGIWGMEDNIFWKEDGKDYAMCGFGFYHETYEKRDGRWVFTSRQLKRIHMKTTVS
jgi:hypothetical protein